MLSQLYTAFNKAPLHNKLSDIVTTRIPSQPCLHRAKAESESAKILAGMLGKPSEKKRSG